MDRVSLKNPLECHLTELEQVAQNIQRDRQAWIDAKLKEHIPQFLYHKVHKAFKEGEDRELIKLLRQVEDLGFSVVHSGLTTTILKNGAEIARYVAQLECGTGR